MLLGIGRGRSRGVSHAGDCSQSDCRALGSRQGAGATRSGTAGKYPGRAHQSFPAADAFFFKSKHHVSPVAQRKDVTVNELLDQISPQIATELRDQPEVRAQVLRTIGSAYGSQGQYAGAEKNLRMALDLQTDLYGEEDAETASTMIELGVLSFRQSKFDEASRLLEKTIAFQRKQRQRNSPKRHATQFPLALDYLGVVKLHQGDAKTSLALLQDALQISAAANLHGNERAIVPFIKSDLGFAQPRRDGQSRNALPPSGG